MKLQPMNTTTKWKIENIDEIHPVGKHHFIHVVFWHVDLIRFI